MVAGFIAAGRFKAVENTAMFEFGDKKLLAELGEGIFSPLLCKRCGIALRGGVSFDELIAACGCADAAEGALHLDHDFAGAPLLVDTEGFEASTFISLTDEDGVTGVAWAEPNQDSGLVGVGLDLASRGDFPFTESRLRWYRRIFTEEELSVIETMCPHNPDLGATLLFSAKEATFKSASQQIRGLFQRSTDKGERFACPYFETRDMEVLPDGELAELNIRAGDKFTSQLLEGVWHARGIEHIGDAGAAFDFLGIENILIRFALVADKVLSVAVALS